MPGAVAALGRELLHEGALQRMQIGAVLQPVERLDGAAVHALASVRQDRWSSPSISTLQAPQPPCHSRISRHVADQFAEREPAD